MRAAVLLAALAVAGTVAAVPSPAAAAPGSAADHVVIVGAAGLRWSDVNPTDTPTLWGLAGRGAVGSMVVRSAQEYTCPADGWLTVGAGNRVRITNGRSDAGCQVPLPEVTKRPGGGAVVARQSEVLEDNENLTYRARPGVLAELVECTVAVGPGAAIAAARPGVGRVDRYVPSLPEDPGPLLQSCPLSVVDAGTVTNRGRRAAVREVDATLERVLAARPERSLVIVAGVADVVGPAHLHVALMQGPGVGTGALASWRPGYARLIDVAPTTVEALGMGQSKWFSGTPLSAVPDDAPRDTGAAVRALVDADRSAAEQPRQARRFGFLLVALNLLLYLAVVPVLWRIRRAAATEDPDRPMWTAAEAVLEVGAVAAGLLVPAALLADLVPWWRAPAPGLVLSAVTVGIVAVLTAAVRFAPWWRTPLGPVASVAGVTVGVVVLDLLTGSRLQLDSVAGYSPVEGGRFAGLSPVTAGVFTAGLLLLAGYLAQHVPRRRAPLLVAAVGGAGVLLAGVAGLDPGSAIALAAGVCLAAVTCTGGWLTANRLLAATLGGLAVTALVILLNVYPSPGHRGRLGRFFADLAEGVPGAMIHRTAEANAITFATSPLTVLTIAGALFGGLVLLRPAGGLLRVFGLYPAIRAALLGSAVAAVLGGLMDGAGVVVVGAATATVLPLLVVMCLRALARAHLRTAPRMPPEDPAARQVAAPRPRAVPAPDTAQQSGQSGPAAAQQSGPAAAGKGSEPQQPADAEPRDVVRDT